MKAENSSDVIAQGWITISQAADLTGYGEEHIRNLVRRSRIAGYKVNRDWLVDERAVLEYKERMDVLGKKKHSPWRPDLAAQGKGRRRDTGS